MALTAAQTTQVFKIFGLPQSGIRYDIAPPSSPYPGEAIPSDYTAVIATLNAILAALTASQEAEVAALLVQWAAVTDYSELKVNADGGSQGRLVDYDTQRAKIRETLGNILGFQTPSAGGLSSGRLIR